jgi:predicted PhzF superfamily epimerase YddE/YHI9
MGIYTGICTTTCSSIAVGGNQLAVFPDAAGLRAQTMQQIAREIGFAEIMPVTAANAWHRRAHANFHAGTEMPMQVTRSSAATFALARTGGIAEGRSD